MDRIVDCLRDRLDLSVDETGENNISCIKECDCKYFNRGGFLFSNIFKWVYATYILLTQPVVRDAFYNKEDPIIASFINMLPSSKKIEEKYKSSRLCSSPFMQGMVSADYSNNRGNYLHRLTCTAILPTKPPLFPAFLSRNIHWARKW